METSEVGEKAKRGKVGQDAQDKRRQYSATTSGRIRGHARLGQYRVQEAAGGLTSSHVSSQVICPGEGTFAGAALEQSLRRVCIGDSGLMVQLGHLRLHGSLIHRVERSPRDSGIGKWREAGKTDKRLYVEGIVRWTQDRSVVQAMVVVSAEREASPTSRSHSMASGYNFSLMDMKLGAMSWRTTIVCYL